jgi:hypothetical protein
MSSVTLSDAAWGRAFAEPPIGVLGVVRIAMRLALHNRLIWNIGNC